MLKQVIKHLTKESENFSYFRINMNKKNSSEKFQGDF